MFYSNNGTATVWRMNPLANGPGAAGHRKGNSRRTF